MVTPAGRAQPSTTSRTVATCEVRLQLAARCLVQSAPGTCSLSWGHCCELPLPAGTCHEREQGQCPKREARNVAQDSPHAGAAPAVLRPAAPRATAPSASRARHVCPHHGESVEGQRPARLAWREDWARGHSSRWFPGHGHVTVTVTSDGATGLPAHLGAGPGVGQASRRMLPGADFWFLPEKRTSEYKRLGSKVGRFQALSVQVGSPLPVCRAQAANEQLHTVGQTLPPCDPRQEPAGAEQEERI